MTRTAKFLVALGCQGGGSHTAFTAGVLQGILADERVEIRALSGTSGGAVCAVTAWSGLVGLPPGEKPVAAITRLEKLWRENETPWWAAPAEVLTMSAMRLGGAFGMSPEFSAYTNPLEAHGAFLELMEHNVPFAELSPERLSPQDPRLLISAVDVCTGEFRVFRSHRLSGREADRISSQVILASAALPTVFRAVRLGEGLYWDGGFSQNPPLRELIPAARRDVPEGRLNAMAALAADAPDASTELEPVELWVIQINPQSRSREPRSMDDIRDRRNELTGNISYLQEIDAIAHLNRLLQLGLLDPSARAVYAPVKIRVVAMSPEVADSLDYESKLQRDKRFVEHLMAHGRDQAALFLSHLNSPDRDRLTALPHRDIWGQWTPSEPA